MDRLRARTAARSGQPSSLRSLGRALPMAAVVLGTAFFLRSSPLIGPSSADDPAVRAAHPANLLLISLDTVRADHLSLYGYQRDTTPNLKKLAKEATVFRHAIAPSDMTLSTHASIFTGLYSRSHGARFGQPPGAFSGLKDEFRTLAEVLSEAGFDTAGTSANYAFLGHDFNLDQGFRYWDARPAVAFLGQAPPYFLRQGVRNLLTRFASPSSFDIKTRPAGEINRAVYGRLDALKDRKRPFFLFVNYMDAHEPYIPPAPFDSLYPGRDDSFTLDDFHALNRGVSSLTREVTEQEHDHLVSQYDGGITYIDDQIGELLQRLKDLELYDDTLMIIFSDHGQHFGERRLFGHGVSVYQELVHVPLVIKYPGVRQAALVDDLVSLVDILPTALDVLGVESRGGLQGKSLREPETRRSSAVIAESYRGGVVFKQHARFHHVARALFSGSLKLLQPEAGKRELYDIVRDPAETTDLSGRLQEAARRLEDELARWLETTTPEPLGSETPSKEALDHLKALGYVE